MSTPTDVGYVCEKCKVTYFRIPSAAAITTNTSGGGSFRCPRCCFIDSLPIKLFPPFSKEEEPESCSICMVDFISEEEEAVIELPCKHYFHKTCMFEWMMRKITCPMCRHIMHIDSRWYTRSQPHANSRLVAVPMTPISEWDYNLDPNSYSGQLYHLPGPDGGTLTIYQDGRIERSWDPISSTTVSVSQAVTPLGFGRRRRRRFVSSRRSSHDTMQDEDGDIVMLDTSQ